MLNPDFFLAKNDSDHVEPEGIAGLLEPGHPDLGRTGELTLFSPVDRTDRAAEIGRRTGFYLYESHGPAGLLTAGGDQIYVAPTVSEPAFGDVPAVNVKPFGGDVLTL